MRFELATAWSTTQLLTASSNTHTHIIACSHTNGGCAACYGERRWWTAFNLPDRLFSWYMSKGSGGGGGHTEKWEIKSVMHNYNQIHPFPDNLPPPSSSPICPIFPLPCPWSTTATNLLVLLDSYRVTAMHTASLAICWSGPAAHNSDSMSMLL